MTGYTDRPITPLGLETGLTSAPVSEGPTRSNSPKPINPYLYQPALRLTHPDAVSGPTSHYLDAVEQRKAYVLLNSGAGSGEVGGMGGVHHMRSAGASESAKDEDGEKNQSYEARPPTVR